MTILAQILKEPLITVKFYRDLLVQNQEEIMADSRIVKEMHVPMYSQHAELFLPRVLVVWSRDVLYTKQVGHIADSPCFHCSLVRQKIRETISKREFGWMLD